MYCIFCSEFTSPLSTTSSAFKAPIHSSQPSHYHLVPAGTTTAVVHIRMHCHWLVIRLWLLKGLGLLLPVFLGLGIQYVLNKFVLENTF